ncbi:MAG TPA: transcription elongation factor GreA [Candidatus Limnocylindrales bacterium]|jgi:transcription elongation factor GreA
MIERRPGASELLKDLGLLVDGPQLWGRPIPGRGPGVFVVELPNGMLDAPIDIVAIRKWLERVPELTLDGERPTAEAVAKRLHEFWLPDEPVLYVGRSPKQVGARINSIYATPLGDARPSSGGHWLRTLSVLPQLRIWWADTDAHEEYEDALLAEIATRNEGVGRDAASGGLLPFANLMTADGVPKAHGLLNSLRSDGTDTSPTRTTSGTTRATASRARTTSSSRARKPPPPKAPPPRPVIAPTLVSRDGLDKLNAELEDLRTVQRPQIIDRVATARSHGDLKENAEYEYARKEQSFIEGRIQTLEQMIRHAQVIDTAEPSDTVRVGSTVKVESDGETFTYQIVGSTEANPAQGRLSNASPVGRALLGAREGDAVGVDLPSGSVTYRVREIS